MMAQIERKRSPDLQSLWLPDVAVAALLGVHRATIWRWLDQGLIPLPRRVGGLPRWVRSEIELFARCASMAEFHRLRRQPTPEPAT
jgi:predicted DNA-binding transcriptional regulator AlpA